MNFGLARAWLAGLALASGTLAATQAWSQSSAPPESTGWHTAAQAGGDTGGSIALRAYNEGVAAYRSGEPDIAVLKLTTAMKTDSLSAVTMTRALYYRGLAYKALHRPDDAIADLSKALEGKSGLNPAERADALRQRGVVAHEAGLPDPQEPQEQDMRRTLSAAPDKKPAAVSDAYSPSAARNAGRPQDVVTGAIAPTTKSEPPAAGVQVSSKQANPEGPGSLAALFSSLGDALKPATPKPAEHWDTSAANAPPTVQPAQAEPKRTRVASTGPVNVPAAAQAQPAHKAAATPRQVRLQLSAHRSRDEAEAELARAMRDHDDIASASASVDEEVFGGVTFWRPHIAVVGDLHGLQGVCARLRSEGIDCMVRAN